jgi:hypothetical protein
MSWHVWNASRGLKYGVAGIRKERKRKKRKKRQRRIVIRSASVVRIKSAK